MTKYYNVELDISSADMFRSLLKEKGIKYESSQAGDYTHFEVEVKDLDMLKDLNDALLEF